jgi:very-short-patch-repair endonuclease
LSPILAIELDDMSHERSDRQERDREVERILKDANMPLLRIKNHFHFEPIKLVQKINTALAIVTTQQKAPTNESFLL